MKLSVLSSRSFGKPYPHHDLFEKRWPGKGPQQAGSDQTPFRGHGDEDGRGRRPTNGLTGCELRRLDGNNRGGQVNGYQDGQLGSQDHSEGGVNPANASPSDAGGRVQGGQNTPTRTSASPGEGPGHEGNLHVEPTRDGLDRGGFTFDQAPARTGGVTTTGTSTFPTVLIVSSYDLIGTTIQVVTTSRSPILMAAVSKIRATDEVPGYHEETSSGVGTVAYAFATTSTEISLSVDATRFITKRVMLHMSTGPITSAFFTTSTEIPTQSITETVTLLHASTGTMVPHPIAFTTTSTEIPLSVDPTRSITERVTLLHTSTGTVALPSVTFTTIATGIPLSVDPTRLITERVTLLHVSTGIMTLPSVPPSPPSTTSRTSNGAHTGVIIADVVALVLVVLAGLCILWRRRRRALSRREVLNNPHDTPIMIESRPSARAA
ncbi:hypothetical protein PQX77_000868 [Marasmius sp. AFHP31]|nr:hypothetical protein PQX77_000868 [Marasmius sp. AFHP31]